MGFSSLQIAADVLFEQCFVIGGGLIIGTLLGLPLGRLMIGYMGIDESGAAVVPPFTSSVSWATVAIVYSLLGIVFPGVGAGVLLVRTDSAPPEEAAEIGRRHTGRTLPW